MKTPHSDKDEGPDPFDPASLRVDARMSDAALGVERPLLEVPVQKPSRQVFFRVHPDADMRMDAAVITLEAERETYLVAPTIASFIPEETKLVRLLTCMPRTGGPFLWPLSLPAEGRELRWHSTARKAAEIAETKWVRMQANIPLGAYDVTTSTHIPDPVWPKHTLGDYLRIAFGDGRLINREDHPVIRRLQGL
jgi:hypothetical protein